MLLCTTIMSSNNGNLASISLTSTQCQLHNKQWQQGYMTTPSQPPLSYKKKKIITPTHAQTHFNHGAEEATTTTATTLWEIGKSTTKTQRENFTNSIFIFDDPKNRPLFVEQQQLLPTNVLIFKKNICLYVDKFTTTRASSGRVVSRGMMVFTLLSLRRCQPQMPRPIHFQLTDSSKARTANVDETHTQTHARELFISCWIFIFIFISISIFGKFHCLKAGKIVNCQVRLAYHAPREQLPQSAAWVCVHACVCGIAIGCIKLKNIEKVLKINFNFISPIIKANEIE